MNLFLTSRDDGSPILGLLHNDTVIEDPHKSECGAFGVDPEEAYGLSAGETTLLSKLDPLIRRATLTAIAACWMATRQELNLESSKLNFEQLLEERAFVRISRMAAKQLAAELAGLGHTVEIDPSMAEA